MGLPDILGFVEDYARRYVAYLFAFFGQPNDPKSQAENIDPLTTVLIFGVMSAFLGSSLAYFATMGEFPTANWLTQRLAVQFAYWVALSAGLYGFLRLLRAPTPPAEVMMVVLGVAPVAYALGGYAGFLWRHVALVWRPKHEAYNEAYFAIVIVQLTAAAIYLPIYIRRLAGVGRWRTVAGTIFVLLLIAAVQLFYFLALVRQGYFFR